MTRTFVLAFLAGIALVAPLAAQQANMSFYDFKTMSLDGKPADLAQYKGQGKPRCERCKQVRVHAAIRGPRKAAA